MRSATLGYVFGSCLGLGAVDLWALNVLIVPELLVARAARDMPKVLPAVAPQDMAAEIVQEVEPLELTSITAQALPPEEARKKEPEPVLILEFTTSSYRVDQGAREQLRERIDVLRSAADLRVMGHADATGSPQLNEDLSRERALSVARALSREGVLRRRIEVSWFGSRKPRASGELKRVEIYLGEMP